MAHPPILYAAVAQTKKQKSEPHITSSMTILDTGWTFVISVGG
jgi:hypothetical protein